MQRASDNLVLIGMPGAGKSTIGVMLAKERGLDFIDTDIIIQVRQGKTLQQISDESGYMALRRCEEQILLTVEIGGKVIATGGSAVYSEAGMARLQAIATIVFLDVSLPILMERIDNFDSRGIACRPGQNFQDIFTERSALYHHYADVRIDCSGLSIDKTLKAIVSTCCT